MFLWREQWPVVQVWSTRLKQHNLTFTARLLLRAVRDFLHFVHPTLGSCHGQAVFPNLTFRNLPSTPPASGHVLIKPGLPSSSPFSPPSPHTLSCLFFPPDESTAAPNDNRSERHQGLEKQILIETKTYRPAESLL